MKKPKSPRVPVLEGAFELNLPKLQRAVKVSGIASLVLDNGELRTVVVLSETRLAVRLGDRIWTADIVAVPCLNDRIRPLLKCPRAHEGNFQSLYYWAGELACRHCHGLRYRSTLVASQVDRSRLTRIKLLARLGAEPGSVLPARQPFKWRKRYQRLSQRLATLNDLHYRAIRTWLER